MDHPTFTAEYLDRLRNEDPETERHFTRHFSNVIWLKLRGRLRSPQLIQDVSQETFLRVLRVVRSDRGLDNSERLAPFVHAVCKNVMLELLRGDTRHPQIPENQPDPVDSGLDPEAMVVTQERKRLVERVLGELPDRDCQILRKVFLEEQDKSEICKLFQVDPGYLRVLVHRAKIRFRKCMEEGKTYAAP